jgi:predicted ATPase/DNA-binding winged helix-turn-helix (wHTH) protein
VTKNGLPLQMGSRSLDILIALTEQPGNVVDKRVLVERVWPETTVDDASLRVHVAGLRKAIGDGQDGARYITNIPGRGYCFVASVSPLSVKTRDEPPVPDGKSVSKLPAAIKNIIGRGSAIDGIVSLLLEKRCVTIVGPGGIGKTTVAVAVSHKLQRYFADLAYFIDLASLTDAIAFAETLASALGIQGELANPLRSAISSLRNQRTLLVLDNCEHLVDAVAASVEQILSECGDAYILTTTREPLRSDGEYLHRLAPLDSPQDPTHVNLDEALQFPAIQLFFDRAEASGAPPELCAQEVVKVAEICMRLDGLPLAIELVAARVGDYGIDGLVQLLGNRFKLQWQGRRTALPRHQNLKAMLDWSYNLLSTEEQNTLQQLSVFVSPFSIEAALAVVNEGSCDHDFHTATISNLVMKSLISVEQKAGRTLYRLLETTRTFAAAKLQDGLDFAGAEIRHAIFYEGLFRERTQKPLRPGSRSDVSVEDIANTRVALEWAFSSDGDSRIGIMLADACVGALLAQSLLRECHKWSRIALNNLPLDERGTETELRLQEAFAISAMFTEGNTDDVREAIDYGLDLAEKLGSDGHLRQLLSGLNIFTTRIGNFSAALAGAQRHASLSNDGTPSAAIISDWMLGVCQHLVGDQKNAHGSLTRGFSSAETLGPFETSFFGYDHRIRALVAHCRTLWLRGLPDQAALIANQALQEGSKSKSAVSTCISLIYTAPVFLWRGEFNFAGEIIARLTEHAQRHSLAPYHAVGMGLQGELDISTGEIDTGVSLLNGAIDIIGRERHNIFESTFTRALAEALVLKNKGDEALAVIDDCIARVQRSGGAFDIPELVRTRGRVLAARNDPRAEAAFHQAITLSKTQSAPGWTLRSAIDLSRLLTENGRSKDALPILLASQREIREGAETADVATARSLAIELSRQHSVPT